MNSAGPTGLVLYLCQLEMLARRTLSTDLPGGLLSQISHFFEHYKDLEPHKWVKVEGWDDATSSHREIIEAISRYQSAPNKPFF